MTEREWALTRELLQTKVSLYGAQNAYLQAMNEKTQAELAALGDKWTPPEPPAEPQDSGS